MKKRILVILLFVVPFIFVGASCETEDSTYKDENKKQEEIQNKVTKATPLPNLEKSLERENLIMRAERLNKDASIGYIYLLSYGKVIAYYPIKGKVSSLNAYLTPMSKLVYGNGNICNEDSISSPSCYVVDSPDVDGSYGENDGGIFFFTTENVYVEWKGEYLFTDQPLKITTPVELVREVK